MNAHELESADMAGRYLKLSGDLLAKYTHGYSCLSELVFVTRGLTEGASIISIKKWAADYVLKDRWASSEDVQRALLAPFPVDSERAAHAECVKKRKRRKKRVAAAAAEAGEELGDGLPESAHERMQQDNLDFETLLAELKMEEAGAACSDPAGL